MTHLPARGSDPTSSWDAAQHMVETGKAAHQRAIAVSAVHKHPGMTSNELSKLCTLGRHQIARRLPECAELVKGPQRACTVTGHKAVTWYVAGSQQVAA